MASPSPASPPLVASAANGSRRWFHGFGLPTPATAAWLGLTAAVVVTVVALAWNRDEPARSAFDEWTAATWYTALLLLLTGVVALMNATGLARRSGLSTNGRLYVLWLLLGTGFLFLAADDLFSLHERLDYAIHAIFGIAQTPWTDALDDAIVGAYGCAGLMMLLAFGRRLRRYRAAAALLIAGLLAGGGSILLDLATNDHHVIRFLFADEHRQIVLFGRLAVLEEVCKLFATALLLLVVGRCWRIDARLAGGRQCGRDAECRDTTSSARPRQAVVDRAA